MQLLRVAEYPGIIRIVILYFIRSQFITSILYSKRKSLFTCTIIETFTNVITFRLTCANASIATKISRHRLPCNLTWMSFTSRRDRSSCAGQLFPCFEFCDKSSI